MYYQKLSTYYNWSSGMTKTELRLEDYLALRYSITLFPEKDGGYTLMIKDLPGYITQGDTLEEAMENIEEAKHL